jgi:S1-C subfamily serine protease
MAIVATFAVATGLIAFLVRGAWRTAEVEREISGVVGTNPDAQVAQMRELAAEAIGQHAPANMVGEFPAIAERVMRSVVRIRTGDIIDARGSGFVVSGNGDILTAAHVLEGGTTPRVTFPDGREFEATVLFADSHTDVALLHVAYQGAPALPLGSSGDLAIGTGVAVLGYPLNQSFERLGFRSETPTLVQGVVAARQAYRPTPLSQPLPVLQIDANLNPGHSGGPVFLRSTGEVVGIANSAIQDIFTGNTDVCFAVPIDVAREEIVDR